MKGSPHACPLEDFVPFEGGFTFGSWASCLPRLLLKAKTAFSRFLSQTLPLSRDDASPVSTALFPLPLPEALPANRSARKHCGRAWKSLRFSRLLHVVVMALNFLHSCFRPIPLDVLRRPPNDAHVGAFKRLGGLIRACGRQSGSMPFCAGRRSAHLIARLNDLSAFLHSSGLPEDGYLDSDGRARSSYGPTGLCKLALWPCMEPAAGILPFLRPSLALVAVVLASISRSTSSCCWSLLRLRPGMFVAVKAPGKFRQIGDRRAQNSYECKALPSSSRKGNFLSSSLCLASPTAFGGVLLIGRTSTIRPVSRVSAPSLTVWPPASLSEISNTRPMPTCLLGPRN